MAAVAERVGVLETKVQHIDEKIDGIKVDVKDMHDCLDRTRDDLKQTLTEMRSESTNQHNELAGKINEIEKFKNKWMYLILGAAAALGWAGHFDLSLITNLIGL
jgi:dsDNA-specific endonuclease/ATPase MutS2